jgi:hypothetical protein
VRRGGSGSPGRSALLALEGGSLEETLGVALKVREDIDQVREEGVLNGV